jgi:outer membrane protein assembly factor BamB
VSPARLAPLLIVALVLAACVGGNAGGDLATSQATTAPTPAPPTTAATPAGEAPADPTSTTAPPMTTAPPTTTTIAPGGIGGPHGEVVGLTMFRGNPSRTYYGAGPIPTDMPLQWRFPERPMCSNSPVGGQDKWWCGSGWTGQPVVWERPDGITEVIFGAYDQYLHFLDAATGERTRPSFHLGNIMKGSVTLDPDGYPLVYAGSRNPRFMIIALDREEPVEVWGMNAGDRPGMWNNDWDSNPAVVDGIMYQGGENSWWYAVELNRGYGDDGLVTLDPEIVFDMPAFTPELVAAVGRNQSVESSTAVHEGRAFFTNSAGRVVGVDVSALGSGGEASVFFDYWMGDDVDATPIVDAEGYLYIAAEIDHGHPRGAEVGQLVKLDPDHQGDDPRVWSLDVPGRPGVKGGMWATPALVDDVLFVATNPGELLAVDTATGEVLWRDDTIGAHAWSSPVHADGRLVVSVGCGSNPALRVYDVSDPRSPTVLAEHAFTEGCIESTPALWKGQLFVGSRDGYFYAVGERTD